VQVNIVQLIWTVQEKQEIVAFFNCVSNAKNKWDPW
jgi:hypothetical protein